MSDFERFDFGKATAELTNYARSWVGIATAFRIASEGDMTDAERAGKLLAELQRVDRTIGIDARALQVGFFAYVCMMAKQTGETPRSVIERQFLLAPADDAWRAKLEGGTDAPEDLEPGHH